jgi:hypothetical protein
MKIIELLEDTSTALQRKLADANKEFDQIKIRATRAGGSIAPQYKAQLNRAKATKDEIKKEIARYNATIGVDDDQRAAAKKMADAKTETPAEKKARFGNSVSEGQDNADKIRQSLGGWQGVADELHRIYTTGTNNGIHDITTEYLAKHLYVTENGKKIHTTQRTIDKWIQTRPEFAKIKRALGRVS